MAAAVPAAPPPTTQTSALNNTGKSAPLKSTEDVEGAAASAFRSSAPTPNIVPTAANPASFMKLRREIGIEKDLSMVTIPFVVTG